MGPSDVCGWGIYERTRAVSSLKFQLGLAPAPPSAPLTTIDNTHSCNQQVDLTSCSRHRTPARLTARPNLTLAFSVLNPLNIAIVNLSLQVITVPLLVSHPRLRSLHRPRRLIPVIPGVGFAWLVTQMINKSVRWTIITGGKPCPRFA